VTVHPNEIGSLQCRDRKLGQMLPTELLHIEKIGL